MTRLSANTEDLAKALRLIKGHCAWPYVRDWLEANRDATLRDLYGETEPMKMNRLVGQHQMISELLTAIENSPEDEASLAKGNSSSEIDPIC